MDLTCIANPDRGFPAHGPIETKGPQAEKGISNPEGMRFLDTQLLILMGDVALACRSRTMSLPL